METLTIASYGQWISENTENLVGTRGDNIYHCLNRADEKPFLRGQKNDTNSTEELWLQWVSTPCPFDEYDQLRRCIGRQPDQCVHAKCKFNCKGFSTYSPLQMFTRKLQINYYFQMLLLHMKMFKRFKSR